MHALRFLAKPVGIVVGIVVAICLLLGISITWSTQHSDTQKQFLASAAPAALPDGEYRVTVSGYAGTWEGKMFSRKDSVGKNIFREAGSRASKYPFTMERAKGILDPQLDVLRLRYNVQGNPAWMHLVVDEIVQTGSGRLLGKMYLTLVPGYPFALGFFELSES